ncbi:TPA: hypothetical protein ACQJMR_005176, partial [Raoultella ornithinolytica]
MSVKGSRYQQSLSQFRTRVMRPVFHEFVFVFCTHEASLCRGHRYREKTGTNEQMNRRYTQAGLAK